MSHEVSETIDRPSGAYNVYGGTQYPLNPVFGFERSKYDSIPQAVNAAQWRSHMGGGPEGGQSPAYGFTPQPEPEYIGMLKTVLQALGDERNSWIGMGPMAGMIKGVGKLRNYFADKEAARMGGFNVPTGGMRRQDPYLPKGAGEADTRGAYIAGMEENNNIASRMRSQNPMMQLEGENSYREALTHQQQMIDKIMGGQEAADAANRQAMGHQEGPPPEMIKRLFGY